MNTIYTAIFKKFLTKTFAEASYLLQQIGAFVRSSDPHEIEYTEMASGIGPAGAVDRADTRN